MLSRLRGFTGIVRYTQKIVNSLTPVRVFSAQATQAQDVYEHMSNMKTKDLFQFEPFNEEDLEVCAF